MLYIAPLFAPSLLTFGSLVQGQKSLSHREHIGSIPGSLLRANRRYIAIPRSFLTFRFSVAPSFSPITAALHTTPPVPALYFLWETTSMLQIKRYYPLSSEGVIKCWKTLRLFLHTFQGSRSPLCFVQSKDFLKFVSNQLSHATWQRVVTALQRSSHTSPLPI